MEKVLKATEVVLQRNSRSREAGRAISEFASSLSSAINQ
jgi:hypothetical protein